MFNNSWWLESKPVPESVGNSTISDNSSSSASVAFEQEDKSIAETKDDKDEDDVAEEEGNEEEEDDEEGDVSNDSRFLSIAAALAAAAWTSRGLEEAGRGKEGASCGKLSIAEFPLMHKAATSWALAAISGVGKVPSHILDFFLGSLISDTHFPQFLIRTPL